jgi:lipoate-protein ligase B
MRLTHLHLSTPIPYARAALFQEALVSRLLAHKASPESLAAPNPTILTWTSLPAYTCGRREINKISEAQRAHLEADGRATFHEALRGGQTTFHGPGQVIAYPVIDLKRHQTSPRCYVRLLEDGTIATCKKYGIATQTTKNPGVWVGDDRKIAALGVHLRRNVTSHGLALNVNTDLWWFDRIVTCGLEGKKTTSFANEGVTGADEGQVATALVKELAERIKGVDDVFEVKEKLVLE